MRVGSSLPSVMFAAKSVSRGIRWHLMAARGAVTRQSRFSRRDALNGRRRCRLCTVASDVRLPMPASSTTSPHSGGIPPFPRHECLARWGEAVSASRPFAAKNRARGSTKRRRSRDAVRLAALAATRRDGFTGVAEQTDEARRAIGAGRRMVCDVPRRRSRPTTATPHRWTRPFRRDSEAAPQQMAHRARPSGSGKAGKRVLLIVIIIIIVIG